MVNCFSNCKWINFHQIEDLLSFVWIKLSPLKGREISNEEYRKKTTAHWSEWFDFPLQTRVKWLNYISKLGKDKRRHASIEDTGVQYYMLIVPPLNTPDGHEPLSRVKNSRVFARVCGQLVTVVNPIGGSADKPKQKIRNSKIKDLKETFKDYDASNSEHIDYRQMTPKQFHGYWTTKFAPLCFYHWRFFLVETHR